MPEYTVFLNIENTDLLETIAEATGKKVEEILQAVVDDAIKRDRADLIIAQYKEGNLTAREAWKLSGLDYQEFQNRANT